MARASGTDRVSETGPEKANRAPAGGEASRSEPEWSRVTGPRETALWWHAVMDWAAASESTSAEQSRPW